MNTTRSGRTADRGSDAAFAKRMRARIRGLLRHPYTFLPSYEKRYAKLLQHAETLTPHQAYAMTMLLGGDSARLYPDMPCTAELSFPAINAMDLTSQFGWYCFAGTCKGEDGVEYGVLCMMFQYIRMRGSPVVSLHKAPTPSRKLGAWEPCECGPWRASRPLAAAPRPEARDALCEFDVTCRPQLPGLLLGRCR